MKRQFRLRKPVLGRKTVGWTYDLAGNVIETHEDAGDFKDR